MTKKHQAIKALLLEKKKELLTRVKNISADLTQNDRRSKDFAEQVVDTENDDVLHALKKEGERELKQINIALEKIEKGNYGICALCHEEIPAKRLKAVPFAEYCLSCLEDKESRR